MSYSLMIAPFDFANHNKIAAQQFFDNYAFFELTPKQAKEYFTCVPQEIFLGLRWCQFKKRIVIKKLLRRDSIMICKIERGNH